MKRLILAAILAVAAIGAGAENAAESFTKAVNDMAPYEMTEGLTVTKAAVTDEGLVMFYDVTDEMFAALPEVSEMLHDALVAELLTSEKERTVSLRNYLVENSMNVIHRMISKTGETHDITLLPTEL